MVCLYGVGRLLGLLQYALSREAISGLGNHHGECMRTLMYQAPIFRTVRKEHSKTHGVPGWNRAHFCAIYQGGRPNLVPCSNLVLSSRELSAHAFRALDSCRHAGEGFPCCPVTSSGTSGATNDRAGEEYQIKARCQVRTNPLLFPEWETTAVRAYAH